MVQLGFAWLALAAFGASLGYFLYAYLVLFGAGAPPPSLATLSSLTIRSVFAGFVSAPALVNFALFTVFALHHSVFARTGVKAAVRARVPPALERAVYTLIASVLFVLVCAWWQPVDGLAWTLTGVWMWAGYAAQAAGIVLTLAGARALDVLDLAGVRQVTDPSRGVGPLTTDGVYGFVRHPLYFAWMLVVFGAPGMTMTRLTFAVISTLYLAVAIPFEERSLVETFGPDYASYQKKVRWRMMPGLY